MSTLVPVLPLVFQIGLSPLQGAPPRDSRPPAAGSAAISGRVSDRQTGRPLPRAVVTLLDTGTSRRFEAATDAEGLYEFTALDAGKYVLWAAPEEFHSTHLSQVFGQPGPMDVLGGTPGGFGFELRSGEKRTGADLALARALAIEGRVLDPWDEPIANLEVAATRVTGGAPAARSVYTDDRGEFRLYGLAPGRYRVCTASHGSPAAAADDPLRMVRSCHPASAGETGAAEVVLAAADATGIDIRVQRAASHSVAGSIVDASGAPADGAGISAVPLGEDSTSAHATSRNGQFVLFGLTPGRYIIQASIGDPTRPGDPPPRRELETGYADVEVGDVDLDGVAIDLSRPQKVAGRVVFEGASTPAGPSLRMVVQTRPAARSITAAFSRPPYGAVTDDLTFQLTHVYRRPLVVDVTERPEGWVVKSVRFDGRDITNVPTDLTASSATRPLEIVLTNRVARPSVRVLDEQGNPVTAFAVVLLPVDPGRWQGAPLARRGMPSAEGVLDLGPTLPGDYLLAAIGTDAYLLLLRDPSRIDTLAPTIGRVTLVPDDTRTFDLRLTTLPTVRR